MGTHFFEDLHVYTYRYSIYLYQINDAQQIMTVAMNA